MDDELINVPTPKRFYSVVIQALAAAMNSEKEKQQGKALYEPDSQPSPLTEDHTLDTVDEDKPESETEAEDKKYIDWMLADNVERLKRGVSGLPIAQMLFGMTAANPGEWIPFKEVYTAANFETTRSAKSSLGALTKIIKRDFGVKRDEANWPVERRWALNSDAQNYYQMSKEVADLWNAP